VTASVVNKTFYRVVLGLLALILAIQSPDIPFDKTGTVYDGIH